MVEPRVGRLPLDECWLGLTMKQSFWGARTASNKVVVMSATLLVAALLLSKTDEDLSVALHPSGWWTLVIFTLAFAVAHLFVFHVEYRREALTYTMTELPMAFALLYCGLGKAIIARVVGGVLVLVVKHRSGMVKLVFNGSLFVFETVLCYSCFHVLLGEERGHGVQPLVGVLIALLVTAAVDALLVSTVISFFEPGQWRRARTEMASMAVVSTVSGIAATLAAALSLAWPHLTILGLVPIAAVWNLERNHGRTAQKLRDFEALHQLSRSVSSSLHTEEIASGSISEIRNLLRSERAAILLFDPTSGVVSLAASTGESFGGLPTTVHDPRWRAFAAAPEALLIELSVFQTLGIPLTTSGGNVIVAPISADDVAIGLILVAERGGSTGRYDASDVLRADAIADRLGLALRNAQLHAQIEQEAWRDALTGVPNRTAIERILDDELDGAPDDDQLVGVMLIGLDRFRDINAAFGHQFGDRVLVEFTARLVRAIGNRGVVGRVAGDEFVVVYEVADSEESTALAHDLAVVVQMPYRVDGVDVSVAVSVGLLEANRGTAEGPVLLRQANQALEWAKKHHDGVVRFRAEIEGDAAERLLLLADLRVALDHRELDVHFQPKVDLVTGSVVGAEALVRWEHPTRGSIPPLDFIELAEAAGLIGVLTDQVITKSVAAIRLCNDLGYRLDVAVNLSTLDLLDEGLVDRVRRALRTEGVPADQLTLEITETALLADGPRALLTATALQRLGVQLSIDDFGTGFSSLSYLRMLPAHELKIDRSFITNVVTEDRDEVIVRSTIDLGHTLGLRVTAEGVEDDATLVHLAGLGCDLAQGFGISRPLPFNRFIAWLANSGFPVARNEWAIDRDAAAMATQREAFLKIR